MNEDMLLYFVYNMLKKKFSQKATPDHDLDNMRDQEHEKQLMQSQIDQRRAKLKADYMQMILQQQEPQRPAPRYLDPVE